MEKENKTDGEGEIIWGEGAADKPIYSYDDKEE